MNTETRKLLGFTLEIFPISEFKEYYKSCTSFNKQSENAFLKSIGIPATYFKEQPKATQEILLNNQEDIVSRKYSGNFILVLIRDGYVLNCCRIKKYDEMDLAFERLTPEVENATPVKDHIKEGYSTVFVPQSEKLKKGEYNSGLFIDYPIMLNKAPKVYAGFYYIPKEGEEFYRSVYDIEYKVDYEDYSDLNLLVSDKLSNAWDESELHIKKAAEKQLLAEVDDVLTDLYKKKSIPKGLIKKISKYVYKNDIQFQSVLGLLELILNYDNNLPAYKATVSLRKCIEFLI